MSIWMIGIGNTLRGDDGAGIAAAQRLSAQWKVHGFPHRLLLCHQLTPELAEELASSEAIAVLFVDAAIAPADAAEVDKAIHANLALPKLPLGTDCLLQRLDSTGGLGAGTAGARLAHHMGPAQVLAYLHGVYGCELPAWLLTLPCVHTPFGEELSAPVRVALRTIEDSARTIWHIVEGSGLHESPPAWRVDIRTQ